ncbi:hypothetical protein RHOER0001_3865 [Rhodococcus erythropolis SK121]|nr:hypothetical protein RHOER0001_3865 [Rhodococcus erythropolis SK121]
MIGAVLSPRLQGGAQGTQCLSAHSASVHTVLQRRGLDEPEGQSLADAQPGETQRIAA